MFLAMPDQRSNYVSTIPGGTNARVLPFAIRSRVFIDCSISSRRGASPRERDFAFEYVTTVKDIPAGAKELTLWLPNYFRPSTIKPQRLIQRGILMIKKVCVLFALFGVFCGARDLAVAQTPILPTRYVTAEASKAKAPDVSTKSNSELAREVELLRHRVEDLESQNHALAELLSAVKTKLDALPDSPSDERRSAGVQPVTATVPRAASIENSAAR